MRLSLSPRLSALHFPFLPEWAAKSEFGGVNGLVPARAPEGRDTIVTNTLVHGGCPARVFPTNEDAGGHETRPYERTTAGRVSVG